MQGRVRKEGKEGILYTVNYQSTTSCMYHELYKCIPLMYTVRRVGRYYARQGKEGRLKKVYGTI